MPMPISHEEEVLFHEMLDWFDAEIAQLDNIERLARERNPLDIKNPTLLAVQKALVAIKAALAAFIEAWPLPDPDASPDAPPAPSNVLPLRRRE